MSNDNLDLDLLDMNLEDIEDIPGFEAPYAGEYVLRLAAEIKDINKIKYLEIGYEVVECTKKNNDEDPDTIPGTKFSQLFALTGDADRVKQSLGYCKKLLAGVAESVGEGNLLILVRDHLPGMMTTATLNRRQDKEDKEKFYPIVKNLRVA